MDAFSRDDLRLLTDRRQGWCVSIFLRTHRAGWDVQQDPIRFKNLLREAEGRLTSAGLRAPEVREFLEPAARLLDDPLFWRHQSDGLAVFLARELMRAYRLPAAFPEVVVVADRFHVKPLLPLLSGDGQFYVLALSQNEVRLFVATRHRIDRVELPGVPGSLAEALKYDDPQRQLQFHTGTPGGPGRRPAMFHGHGTGIDDAKDNILRFFQQIDRGVAGLLRDERAPLVLAGVEYLLPLYRQANSYAHLAEGGLTGNPEGMAAGDLHMQTWPLVEPIFHRAQDDAVARYRQMVGTGLASHALAQIVLSAMHGRVETLFAAVGAQRWGVVDAERGTVDLHDEPLPGDEDVINIAALQTLLHGGTVYAVEPERVPDAEQGAGASAVFRY